MKVHILGICGTFMGGIAVLAKQAGHEVSGSDEHVYPPMSTQLTEQGIHLREGFDPAHIPEDVDVVIVGNVIKRGNAAIEHVLSQQLPFVSGPQWLYENILRQRHVLAIAGTHGKTTASSMLAWVLESAGLEPGFLIGGVPENFGVSARIGAAPYFVIEADEYDTAFFDKRSKFMHYHPRTLVMNNLEYDHADIFPDLDAIKRQFHHLVRVVPNDGLVIYPNADVNITHVLEQGCWTPKATMGAGQADWAANCQKEDGSHFVILHHGKEVAEVKWSLLGMHNVHNALGAMVAAHHVGVAPTVAAEALSSFKNVKRRLEIKGKINNITVYDDFAHHPTAITSTLAGLRKKIGAARLIAVVEFGSYTMRTGYHKDRIVAAFNDADRVICRQTTADWGLKDVLKDFHQPTELYGDVGELLDQLVPSLQQGDHVIIMSNASFDGIHQKLLDKLSA